MDREETEFEDRAKRRLISKYQLTAREYEVWTMIARGMTQSAIAEEIHLSPATAVCLTTPT